MLPSVGLGVQHFLRRKKKLEVKAEGFFKTLTHTVVFIVFLPLVTVRRTFTRAYILLKLVFLEPNNSKLRKRAQDMNKIINVLERIPGGILFSYQFILLFDGTTLNEDFVAIPSLAIALVAHFFICIYSLAANASKRNFPLLFISLTLELGYRWLVLSAIMFMNKTVGGAMIGVLSLMYFCNVCLNGTCVEDGVYDWIGSYSSPFLTQIEDKFSEK